MKLTDGYFGERIKGFLPYAQIAEYDFEPMPEPEPEPDFLRFDERKKPDDLIFDEIFAVNPLTKLPDGDIACFVNENTSESVRTFILQNLTRDNGLSSDSADFAGLDDDVIALYTRGIDEPVAHYRDRVIEDLKASYRAKSES